MLMLHQKFVLNINTTDMDIDVIYINDKGGLYESKYY